MTLPSIKSYPLRAYQSWRRIWWSLRRRVSQTAVVHTRQGSFEIPMDVDDPISKSLFVRGEYESDLMTRACCFLRGMGKIPQKGNGTLLDVGANNGVISIGMLHNGEFARSIAIEPEPRNFSILNRNIRRNGFEAHVHTVPYAVGDVAGNVTFELSTQNFGDHRVRQSPVFTSENRSSGNIPDARYDEAHRQVIEVPVRTVDELIATMPAEFTREISLFWIDVQGYEGYAFRGAKNLLSKGVPVMVEIWPYGIERAGMTLSEFNNIVESQWKRYWVLTDGQFRERAADSFLELMRRIGTDGNFENVIFTN